MRVVLEDLARQFANSDRAAVNKINLVMLRRVGGFAGSLGLRQDHNLAHDGLEQPDSGRITIQDRDITDLAPKDAAWPWSSKTSACIPP